jgi:hypothetical protein
MTQTLYAHMNKRDEKRSEQNTENMKRKYLRILKETAYTIRVRKNLNNCGTSVFAISVQKEEKVSVYFMFFLNYGAVYQLALHLR